MAFCIRVLAGVAILLSVAFGQSDPPGSVTRPWTDVSGQETDAMLVAFDGVRATFVLDGGKTVFVSPRSLSAPNQKFLSSWRDGHPELPWIDAARMPPWPSRAGPGPVRIQALPPEPSSGLHTVRSRHFIIQSDVPLLSEAARDVATVLEATRELVYTLPLGLRAEPILPQGFRWMDARAAVPFDPDRLYVQFFSTPETYAATGAPAGSGGYYAAWRHQMVISLHNFGIRTEDGRQLNEYRKNFFVLKHEVTHQLLHHWLPFLPLWLNEGLAEYIAAVPLDNGRYHFEDLDTAFVNYLNRWRFEEDPRQIPMLHPELILSLTSSEWQAALSLQTPILHYNSAALLTYYFLHQDAEGSAAHLAAFIESVRTGPAKTILHIDRHLLRKRSPGQIAQEIAAHWKAHGIQIQFMR